jgi:hypothetical protein
VWSNEVSTNTNAEVVILGGGLVGMTLAIGLAKVGITSVVVDNSDPAAQTADGFEIPGLRGEHQRRPSVFHPRVNRRAIIRESIDHLGLSDKRGEQQRGIEVLPVIRREFLHAFPASFGHGEHDGHETALILGLGIGSLPQKPFHHCRLVGHHGRHQRGSSHGPGRIDGKTVVEQMLGGFPVARSRRHMQRTVALCVHCFRIETAVQHLSHHRDVIASYCREPSLCGH